MSDDGGAALVVIAMLGSPFSPWYFAARQRDPDAADPLRFASFNVAVYAKRGAAWSLHETSRVERSPDSVRIGASVLSREGTRMTIGIHAPSPRYGRVRGRVRIDAPTFGGETFAIDPGGRHSWRPIAPRARVQVELDEPRVRWSGWGYVDGNAGDEPLERSLRGWTWSRVHLPDGRAHLFYSIEARDGREVRLACAIDEGGTMVAAGGEGARLPATRWGLSRVAHAERPDGARLVRTLEDTPFYARSLVEIEALGMRGRGIHEALSLDRFASRWVRFLLPFRIRREVEGR